MPRAGAKETSFGDIELSFPFAGSEQLRDDLKAEIPGRYRRWDPDDKVWRVGEPHAQAAVDLLLEHFPYASVPEAYRRMAPVVVTERPPPALGNHVTEVMPPSRPAPDELPPIMAIIPCPACGDQREHPVRVVAVSAATVARQERPPAEMLSVCDRCRTLAVVAFLPAVMPAPEEPQA